MRARRRRARRPPAAADRLAALAAVLALTACTTGAPAEDPRVAAPAWPLAWLVREVGGTQVQVLDPPRDPHDATAWLPEGADLYLTLPGLLASPAGADLLDLSAATRQQAATSALGDEGGGPDPHVWLDPLRLAEAAEAVGPRLADLVEDPEEVQRRTAAVAGRLRALDARANTALSGCARTLLVTAHGAFGALAERYGLEQVGVADATGAPASPQRVRAVTDLARAAGVTTVFAEQGPGDPQLEAVAQALGADLAVLSPLETPMTDVVDGLERDLVALRSGLDCPAAP